MAAYQRWAMKAGRMDSRRAFDGRDALSMDAVSRRPCYWPETLHSLPRIPEGCHGQAWQVDPGLPSCWRDRDRGGPPAPLRPGGEDAAGGPRQHLECKANFHEGHEPVKRHCSHRSAADSAHRRPQPRLAARTHGAAVLALLLFRLAGVHSAEALLGGGSFSTLEVTQGQILSQSPTDATSSR